MPKLKIVLTVAAAVACCFVFTSPASAGHIHELRHVVADYEHAVRDFERQLDRCRRGSDYSERIASRLVRAAGDLECSLRSRDPRSVAVAYDEVYLLHTRLEELLVDPYGRSDPQLLRYWGPVAASFTELVCAIEGCETVCPLIRHRRQVSVPVVAPHVGQHPLLGVAPSFGGHGFGNPGFSNRGRGVTSITVSPTRGIQFGVHSTNPFARDPFDRGGVRPGQFDHNSFHNGLPGRGNRGRSLDDRDRRNDRDRNFNQRDLTPESFRDAMRRMMQGGPRR
ncbi:hypothetical protein SH139x_004512 [Planctomycetaceae bacterium SH139]